MKKRINITIDEKTLFIVDSLAESRCVDRSTMITLCIRQFDLCRDNFCELYYKYNALEPEQACIPE